MSRQRILPVTLAGDDDNVKLVHTRIISLVANGSELGVAVDRLNRAFEFARSSKVATLYTRIRLLQGLIDKEPRFGSAATMQEYYYAGLTASSEYLGRGNRLDKGVAKRLWEKLSSECNVLMNELGHEDEIPTEMPWVTKDLVFDATSYWRDWHRTKDEQ
jgi:hypothetical protein